MATTPAVTPATEPIESKESRKPPSARLMSVDIFRGLAVAGMILVDNPGSDANAFWPIKHAQGTGWTPAEFMFPSFVFLAGVSTVFSVSARRARGQSGPRMLL